MNRTQTLDTLLDEIDDLRQQIDDLEAANYQLEEDLTLADQGLDRQMVEGEDMARVLDEIADIFDITWDVPYCRYPDMICDRLEDLARERDR